MAAKQTRTTTENEAVHNGSEAAPPPSMSVAEAGRKGGLTTAKRRGSDFYREIGRKGGVATSEAHGPNFYSEIGRKGGEARAEDADVRSGALGRKGAQARWGNGDEAHTAADRDDVGEGTPKSRARAARDAKPPQPPSK